MKSEAVRSMWDMLDRFSNRQFNSEREVTNHEIKIETVVEAHDGAQVEVAAGHAGGMGGFAAPEKRESPGGQSRGSRELESLRV